MTKTPDEIKKGLECCKEDECFGDRENCPYTADPKLCVGVMCADALALIKQLQDDNAQLNRCIENMTDKLNAMNDEVAKLQAERDALKEALGLMVYQYCVRGDKLDHLYMCAGETAFRVLGLEQYGNTSSLESWLFPEFQDKEE